MKIGLVFELTRIKRPCWSMKITEKESGCWVRGCRAQLVTLEDHFMKQTPAEVHRPISPWCRRNTHQLMLPTQPRLAAHPATVSRTLAWGVGLMCQFMVHYILENCWLSLLMLFSIKVNPEKYVCSGTGSLFSHPCSRKGHTRQRNSVNNWTEPGLSPSAHPDSSMCHSLVLPVFICFYPQRGARICDLNVWDRHFKSHMSLLGAWDRCQGCCLIVSNIKADSHYERNLSSAEISEIPLQSAPLFGLWTMRPWKVI